MKPILAMAEGIATEYADIYGQRISTANSIRLARAALEALIDDLAGNVKCAVLIEKAALVVLTGEGH